MCRFCSVHASLVYIFDTIEREFGAEKIVGKFEAFAKNEKGEIEIAAKKTFGEYGKNLMKRILELCGKSAEENFDNLDLEREILPQWFIEMAYVSIQPLFFQLNVVENNRYRFVFRIDNCSIFNILKKRCGDHVANQMPCKHACITASETVYKDLGLKASVSMDATMAEDGYCRFTAKNLEV